MPRAKAQARAMDYGHCYACLQLGSERYDGPVRLLHACYICHALFCDAHLCVHLRA